MQAHSRLAGPGAALDHERRLGRTRDQSVLVRLDRRDDVAHARVARALELLEEDVVDRRGGVGKGAVERLVAEPEQLATTRAEAAAQRDTWGSAGVAYRTAAPQASAS
jgi:hypothetical protein